MSLQVIPRLGRDVIGRPLHRRRDGFNRISGTRGVIPVIIRAIPADSNQTAVC
jgi:hypothetical protein